MTVQRAAKVYSVVVYCVVVVCWYELQLLPQRDQRRHQPPAHQHQSRKWGDVAREGKGGGQRGREWEPDALAARDCERRCIERRRQHSGSDMR